MTVVRPLDFQFKTIMHKNTDGLLEYICEAHPGVATSATGWRIRKLVYDSSGFNTQVLWADGTDTFTKEADEYLSYTYSA